VCSLNNIMSESVILRDDVLNWLWAYAQLIDDHRQYLTGLDASGGDGDHGTNMQRGLRAAQATTGKDELTLADWARAFEAGVNGIISRGKTAVGDRTMVDTLVPAAHTLNEAASAGTSLGIALRQSAQAAQQGMQSTSSLVARKGCAAQGGDQASGGPNAGAVSEYLLVEAAATTWGQV
jgi:phosphoenolpyruvate---glycerone phosphotransferase subunit DhaL